MESVSTVGCWRITHGFHRNTSLMALIEALPDDSIDHFDSVDLDPPVIAVIEVAPQRADERLTAPRSFVTDFVTQDGQRVRREWEPAAGNTRGAYLAVFGLADDVVGGETRPAGPAGAEPA